MKRIVVIIVLCTIFTMFLAGCNVKYKEEQFLGKTSAEIENEYGQFDCVFMPANEDGSYRSCRCGYTIKDSRTGFWGTSPELLFFIYFDGNGIAVSCNEGYRPGG